MCIDKRRRTLAKILENSAEVCDECGNQLVHSAMALDDGDDIKVLCFMCHPSTRDWIDASIRNTVAKNNMQSSSSIDDISFDAKSKTMNVNITVRPTRTVEYVQVSMVAPEGVTVEDIQEAINELDSETADALE
ncbi:MAG: hypothetical protein KAS32_06350 [Candidatus Peribacteraceae bacterium]|nr:hypothetical protein [Candidatus Peribacteraceae bacterium]